MQDGRGNSTSIGKRSDGSAFTPSSNVAEWMTHSLAAALSREGFAVVQVSSEAAARARDAANIVAGTIEQVWLTEDSATHYSCSLRVTLAVSTAAGKVLEQSFSSSLSRRVAPLSSVPQEMLSEAQADLSASMAEAIRRKLSR